MFSELRKELYDFYLHCDEVRAKSFSDKCYAILDSRLREGMTVTEGKFLQYEVITEEFDPVIFLNTPFYFETGVLTSLSDGARFAKEYPFFHANSWNFRRNEHLFIDQDKDLYEKRRAQSSEKLYLICGAYNDTDQHFNFNNRPILSGGLSGIYKRAKEELKSARDSEEREFLESVASAMLFLKRMAEKFGEKAELLLREETDEEKRGNLSLIATTARRVPWEAPSSLYEALQTLAFMRVAVGSLEGVGLNTFGRIDLDLIDFYRSDIEKGSLTEDEAYRLICQFLIIWDCHYDHDMPMIGYSDHELENTYVLGGCDADGAPVYNELTRLFLRANREERIIFPKIKCRFSSESPREYLEEICAPILEGSSTVLLQNDEATIPAVVGAGRDLSAARDYLITGCWMIATYQEKFDHGNYLNLLKPFEFSLHNMTDKMKKVGIDFECFDGCESFEELYEKTLSNCKKLLEAKLEITRAGGQIFHKVDRFPIFSSTLDGCLESRKDFTMGGALKSDDYHLMFGFPNVVDSLLVAKELAFDTKKHSFSELLSAVRANWVGYESLRAEAIGCHGWGDGSEESISLAKRFNDDLYRICKESVGTYGGRVHMGHLTYTEIRFWGEETRATLDGRRNGEYFAQGLTPSRLKRIGSATGIPYSMRAAIAPQTLGAGSVVNIILPKTTSKDACVAFLRGVAKSSVQSLQLNCTSKEELLDAQKNPEKYPDLIVRVTGFSAKFTSLSKGWQDEVISRNFYEN